MNKTTGINIGFLACPETMPSNAERRGDAFEHDLQMAAFRPAFAALGMELEEIEWRAPLQDFSGKSAVLLGTAWDYQDHAGEFLAKLEALENAGILVCNPPSLVRWNIDKTYLKELAESGAKTIPTLWNDDPDAAAVGAAFDHFGCDRLVVKRQIGAGGMGQHLFERGDPPASDWRMGHPAMMQPFLPAIQDEGELSFVFIDGEFSHAILKTSAAGEYRIQSLYGGKEAEFSPSETDINAATAIVRKIPGTTPLYARIDMLRADDGQLMVMEAEAIEPFLYPVQGPDLGKRLAAAIANRLG